MALVVCLLQQSSLMDYLVVGITRELNKEPSLYYPLYIYMIYTCTTEMKMYDIEQWRYDIRAHVGSMVALWKTHVDE